MKANNKAYSPEEYNAKLSTFIENSQKVERLNAKAQAVNSTATYALNKFADWTAEEFSVLLGMKGHVSITTDVEVPEVPEAPLASFDWRTHAGVITPVKDQGQCGSCWAFATVEACESRWVLNGNSQQILSPQPIVDCDKVDGGCDGGDPENAFNYVHSNGLETNAAYPYRAVDGNCAYSASKVVSRITGYKVAVNNGGSEATMASVLSTASPLTIAVDAEPWQFYNGGILTAAECGMDIDHAVQAVGYDTTQGFWIVKNSWAADWGENGYIRLQYGKNTCGITTEVTYAV
jgi:C1A family cysteine protease